MENIFVGDFIKKRRRELNLTQEEVCEGICDCTTLSRVENGKHAPSRTRLNAILQRLGLPDERYFAVMSKNEVQIEALRKEIVGHCVAGQKGECWAELAELKMLAEPDDFLIKQFILRIRVLLGKADGYYSPQEQLKLLLEAIHITNKHFDLEEIGGSLYTFEEMKIINQMALVYSDMGDHAKALQIFRAMLQYVEGHYQEVLTTSGMLQLVCYNYARELALAGQYEESIQLAKRCREACILYAHYQLLPGCLAIAAECCFFLGQREESAEYYKQAYYIYKAVGNRRDLETVVREARERLDLRLEG